GADEPAREGAVGDLADADSRGGAGRGADGVRAAFFAAADGQGLAGLEGEVGGQVGRDVESDRGGVIGERIDAGDDEGVEVRARPSARGGRGVLAELGWTGALVGGALVGGAL